VGALDLGREALRRGEWSDARRAFESAIRREPTADALEGLGLAAWWLDQADIVFDSRERAYRLYLDHEDRIGAARLAVWIAWDYSSFRGEQAVSHGWLRRARQLLQGHDDCAERGWLAIREGNAALFEDGDPDRARAFAEEAVRVGQKDKCFDVGMVGRALAGFATAVAGQVTEGLRELDGVNAAVLAGELSDPVAIALACCYLVTACERVRDTERAVQWCNRLRRFCRTWGLRPLLAVCRTQYASVCLWRGAWSEAERELTMAAEDLAASRPALTADSLARLAELRRRQGRHDEAIALLDQTVNYAPSLIVRAAIALDRDDPREAARLAERALRHLPEHNRAERAPIVELLGRAYATAGRLDDAQGALVELREAARLAGTMPLAAAASATEGIIASAAGEHEAARRHLEDAVDRFERIGAPFEEGRARIELARVLALLQETRAAEAEGRRAVARFESMTASSELARAQEFVASVAGGDRIARDGVNSAPASGLTRREIEIVRMIAGGLNNAAIARRLFISAHTVHRHVANVFTKLDVPTRSAAVARAAALGILGDAKPGNSKMIDARVPRRSPERA
jgi:ATP/maltotriose-dependent transcriptional regulator MalT